MNLTCDENNCVRCNRIKKRFSFLSLLHCKSEKHIQPLKISKKILRRSQRIIIKQSKKNIYQGILHRSHRIRYHPVRFHEEFNY
jgi:hypothetical protein